MEDTVSKEDNKIVAQRTMSSPKNRFWNIMEPFHILPPANDHIDGQISENYKSLKKFSQNINHSSNSSDSINCCEFNRNRFDKNILMNLFSVKGQFMYRRNILIFVITFLLCTSTNCLAARQEDSQSCLFPQRWEGSWFQAGVPQPIDIKNSVLGNRGRCIASDGDKFLIVNDKCRRCVVIYEKHANVLQYKESECEDLYTDQKPAAMPMRSIIRSDHNRGKLSASDQFLLRTNDDAEEWNRGLETLQFLCDQIPGDAQLFSMFKIDAEPIKCPIKGPFSFTYNRGHGECKNPVSNIKSCTEDSRMLFNFQACPDVDGTESTTEELTCLAAWKDGNARYIVGLLSRNHAISNEDRFRCFVYEKVNGNSAKHGPLKDVEYKLAQSGDASCNGLESAEVGSRIMTLRKAPPVMRCEFPAWYQAKRHWHDLTGNIGSVFHQSDGSLHIMKQNGNLETKMICEQLNKQTQKEVMAVAQFTTGCQSGFRCMMFYHRDTYVIELQMGTPSLRLEDACAPDHFDINTLPYITLLAANPEKEICPLDGIYTMKGAIGPPFLASRHKRNRINKQHGSHHHHDSVDNSNTNKRHNVYSFRNTENNDQNWHSHSHVKSIRHRRSVEVKAIKQRTAADDGVLINVLKNELHFVSTINQLSRNKRDTSNCVGMSNTQRTLSFGCTDESTIDVDPSCGDDGDEEYSCFGSWTDNQTTFVVAKHSATKHGICITMKKSSVDVGTAQLFVGDTCYRDYEHDPSEVTEHFLVANLTNVGRKCGDRSASSTFSNYWILICLISWTSIFLIIHQKIR